MLKHLFVMSLVILTVLLVGCRSEVETLTSLYDGEMGDLTKIEIRNGNTGKQKVIDDEVVIEAFIADIKDVRFILSEKQQPRDGFNYTITLYESHKNVFAFNLTKVKDRYYYTEPSLLPIVDAFYRNLD